MTTVFRNFVEQLGGSDANTFIGSAGEIFYDPNTTTLRLSDGSTPGGIIISSNGSLTQTLSWNPGTSTLSISSGNSIDLSALVEDDTLDAVTGRGATTTNNIEVGAVTVSGHVLPSANLTYDLGSTTKRFRDLFISANTIHMGINNSIGFAANNALLVNGSPLESEVNTFIDNSTTINNLTDGSGWSLPGPYTNESAAASAGIAIGQAYYDNGGTVRVRLT